MTTCKEISSTRVALVAAIAVLFAAGCATSESTETGSAAADGQKGRDTRDCLNMARSSVAGPQGPRMVVNQDRYQQCMRERGHEATPAR